jgi:hypothetical protein
MEYVGAYFPNTVFGTKCRSWYKKGLEGEPESLLSLSFGPPVSIAALVPG